MRGYGVATVPRDRRRGWARLDLAGPRARSTPWLRPARTDLPDHIDAAVLKIAGVVVIGAIMSILDITVVNVALPTLQTVFGTPGDPIAYSTVAWTVTATRWRWPRSSR